MKWLSAFLLAILLASSAAMAQPKLVPDVSQREIVLRSGFTGEELLLFGAILYPGGKAPTGRVDMAVVIEGPRVPITVREKQKLAGLIWVNADDASYRTAPSFYAVASTRPIAEMISDREAYVYEIGLSHLQLSPITADNAASSRFLRGLVARNKRDGLYAERPDAVTISEDVLYRARLNIPASVPVGTYDASTYLIQNGSVVAVEETEIVVGKSGFERFVSTLARNYGLQYGLIAVLISLALGWAAGYIFRKI